MSWATPHPTQGYSFMETPPAEQGNDKLLPRAETGGREETGQQKELVIFVASPVNAGEREEAS